MKRSDLPPFSLLIPIPTDSTELTFVREVPGKIRTAVYVFTKGTVNLGKEAVLTLPQAEKMAKQ